MLCSFVSFPPSDDFSVYVYSLHAFQGCFSYLILIIIVNICVSLKSCIKILQYVVDYRGEFHSPEVVRIICCPFSKVDT